MSKKIWVIVIIFWILLRIVEYFLLPYFINAALWLLFSLGFLTASIISFIKVVSRKKWKSKTNIADVVLFGLLFLLTYKAYLVDRQIEKLDWSIFAKKRAQIVDQVKSNELKPNVSYNPSLCHLPFDFPILSNDGNDIIIFKNESDKSVTVKFWISRGFFDAPQAYFIFTNDTFEIKAINSFISKDPEDSWKISDNWYRVLEH